MLSQLLRLPKSLFVCLLLQDIAGVLGDTPPFFDDKKFDNGDYGPYPMQRFYSSELVAPRLNVLTTHPSCDDGSYTMFNPRGTKVPDDARGPMIIDAQGNLVWTVTGYEQTYDLMAQEYKGKQYLTFWSGNDAIGGHGNGHYIMLDTSYKEVARISAGNGLWGDLHEFRFTDAGTALLTVYDVQPIDLTPVGASPKGWIWDSVFQELNIETGEVVFQWRASEHFSVVDSYHPPGGAGNSQKAPYDFFHINSVEKDPKGNYLISSRYTSTVSYIDGRTGEVIWVLGGKRNQFADLSDGRATDFRFQHDARWQEDHTMISLFSNDDEPGQKEKKPFSRPMKIRVDTVNFTAQLEGQYINKLEFLSSSQGSMQVLPNKNVLVGYGFSSAFTEFSPSGVALCESHFGASSRFGHGDVQSYRVMKFNWTGTPETRPSMTIISNSAFVSWNGATEVQDWVLETGEKPAGRSHIKWTEGFKITKEGFEMELVLPKQRGTYVRISGLDAEGKILGTSRVPRCGGGGLSSTETMPRCPWQTFNHVISVYISFGFEVAYLCRRLSTSPMFFFATSSVPQRQ
ncbi:hypothetical protein P280DRAFT_490477 [Massarina eburnea CBS 473.64]|uniref:Arylsulfotransferase n=1 Tax=Massarina eburnea CBS 473.64 TaxID=1395130 RepID=A0A6A6RX19_9PLEO|nr:hypothetical protein P280DRAFT_490477 [Massarina eburnea CBS 473.64]